MKKLYLVFILLTSVSLYAKTLTSPIDVMKSHYGEECEISKKNILINAQELKKIQNISKVKITSKIFKIFIAKKGDEVLAHGILINKKVRSKNAVVLYLISNKSVLDAIEVIAFNEPLEYLPTPTWKKQFANTPTDKSLNVGDEIATITGATLSARSITDGSRLAMVFYNEKLK